MQDIKTNNIFSKKEHSTVKGDKLVSIAIMSSFGVLTIQYFILYYFNISQTSTGSQVQLMSKVIVGLFFLIAIPIVIKRNWLMLVSTYMISIFIFLHNYLVFPQNTKSLLSVVFPFFFICLPSFVFSFSINDKDILMNMICKVSNLVFIVGSLVGILIFTNKMAGERYSMALSYYMLLPGIINMYEFVIKKSAGSMLKVMVSLLVILALGSRGAIMCFGAYLVLVTIRNIKRLTYFSLLSYISIILVLTLGIVYFKNIIMHIYDLLMKFGIDSRTLYLFTQEDLHLSGRDSLIEEISNQIIENPVIGIGIAGDRTIIGGYTHNIFMEILSGYGVIIGIIVIATIGLISYIAIFNKNKFDSNIIIIWFCLGFVPLLVSGTYLIEFTFWIFLGLSLRDIKNRYTIKL